MDTVFQLRELRGASTGRWRLDTASGSSTPATDLSPGNEVLLKAGSVPGPVRSSTGRTVLYAKRIGFGGMVVETIPLDAVVPPRAPAVPATQEQVAELIDAALEDFVPDGGSQAEPAILTVGLNYSSMAAPIHIGYGKAGAYPRVSASVQCSEIVKSSSGGEVLYPFADIIGTIPPLSQEVIDALEGFGAVDPGHFTTQMFVLATRLDTGAVTQFQSDPGIRPEVTDDYFELTASDVTTWGISGSTAGASVVDNQPVLTGDGVLWHVLVTAGVRADLSPT